MRKSATASRPLWRQNRFRVVDERLLKLQVAFRLKQLQSNAHFNSKGTPRVRANKPKSARKFLGLTGSKTWPRLADHLCLSSQRCYPTLRAKTLRCRARPKSVLGGHA